MQTTLPDLPLPATGVDLLLPRSSSKLAAGTSPRTDLETLQPWVSFTHDIQEIIHTHMAACNIPDGTQLTVGNLIRLRTKVQSEEGLRAHADLELHAAVDELVENLGINDGFFTLSSGGNVPLVGEPDFLWVSGDPASILHPKLVVEYVADWVAGLEDLPAFFAKPKHRRKKNQKQSVSVLEQVYGYMLFNNLKYGVLSNWTRAWFFRRDARSKTVECAGPIELCGSSGMPSMLKAFVGMVLLAERDDANPAPPPPRFFGSSEPALEEQKRALTFAGNYDIAPSRGSYPLLPLDLRLCDFDFRSDPHSRLVRTRLSRDALNQPPLEVICKIADIVHTPNSRITLRDETKMYAALRNLQGDVIPKLYGYYEVWGILHILALEPVGDAISEEGEIPTTLRDKMKSALARVHAAGYVHGDIARRNFCEQGDKVFIIDLERSRRSKGDWEIAEEMESIDFL